jgi:hypothetical protein
MYARSCFILALAVGLLGCSGYYGPRGIMSDDASQKIPAMKRAADRNDRSAIPEMIKALDSDDPAVRFYAIESLERMTKETFGYHYFDESEGRRLAIERWQKWSKEQNRPEDRRANATSKPLSMMVW